LLIHVLWILAMILRFSQLALIKAGKIQTKNAVKPLANI